MTQPQNPNSDPLLARIDKNPTGADLIQVVNTAGGQGIVYRINQFQAIWYVGSGNPTFIPGELPTNLYLDNLTGHIWQLGFNFVWTLLPSGGGGGGSTVQTLSTTQGTITGAFDGVNNMFTLSTAPDTPTDLMVFLNGIYQVQGTDYTLAGSIVTLTVTPDVGGELVAIINISTESLIDTLSSTDGTITGTFNGINTVFNLVISPSETINTALFLNGVYQIQGTDYTMVSSTITMTIPPINGDQLTAIISTSGSSGGGVVSLNGLLGVINLVAGANTTIATSGQNITISASGSSAGVSSFNSLSGAVTETAGTGISLTTVGNNIQINNTGVRSINSLTGTPSVTAGTGINVTPSGSSIQVSNTGITSLNSETGAVNITAGANITVTPSGSNIQISSTGASGVASINGLTGTPSITPGSGVSVNVSGSSIQVSALTTPWLDIQNFGGKPRIFFNSQATTTLTSGSSGSPNIGIAASNGFVNGDGIVIWEAGNATGQTSPASFPTASALVVQGGQSIKYAVVGADTLGGLTAVSSTTTVTNAPAVFGNLAVVISSISASGGTVTANFASPINAVANQTIHIVGVTGSGVTWNGVWIVASAPTASQVTFAVSGATGTGTVSGTSTGRLSNVQPITAISRSAAGVITITTAQNHNYVAAPTSQNAAVVIVENVTPPDLNGQYVMATASGNTITCNSGQFIAESGTVTAGSSTATSYEYILVLAPVYSTGNSAFYIYSDSYSPGSALKLVGKTLLGERGWKDYGPTLMQGFVAPAYVPISPPGSAQLQMFGSTVVSGGGTTSLVLANPVPNPSGGLVVMHDDAQAMIAAFAAANAQPDNFGALLMSPPQSIIEFPQYILNYPVTVPLNFQLMIGCAIQINETLVMAGSNTVTAPFGSNRNTSPQFGIGTYATLVGNANPLVYAFGDREEFDNIGFFVGGSINNVTNQNNGQYGIIVRGGKVNFKSCMFDCGPSSTSIPLVYNDANTGGGSWYSLEDVQFVGGSTFGNNHVPGQSSLLPGGLPCMWVHWSDSAGAAGTGPGTIQMYGNCSFSGRGILLDALNYTTNATNNFFFGSTGEIEYQSPCYPSLACWGAIFHDILMANWVNDSQQGPILANWNSVYLANVSVINCTTSGNESIVTGNLVQTLYFEGCLTPTLTTPSSLGQSVQLVAKAIGSTLTTTGTTSDTLTVYGATSISQVTYGAGNAAAAVDIAAGNVYISATASNSVTIQHSATSGMIFNLIVLGAY